jgi:hypothetical protein
MTWSRREILQVLGSTAAACALGTWAEEADAKQQPTQVVWKSVTLPEDRRRARRELVLKKILKSEARTEDWGKHPDDRVEASVKVVEFQVTKREDVVRVTCTAVGRLKNGPSVRTHFSIGDHPKRQDALEKMVLTLVARGVVTRLASIARNRSARRARASK